MADVNRRRLLRTTIIFWLLLIYIIVALVWWFISLERQNHEIALQQYNNVQLQKGTLTDSAYNAQLSTIKREERRNTGKYVAEGVTFLILILTGAVFV